MTYESVTVTSGLEAAPEDLCAALADSARLARLPGFLRVEVLTPGAGGPTSAGTVRKVVLPGWAYLVEEFTAVAPTRFDYRIVASRPRFRHEAGSVVFERDGKGGTRATWTTRYGLDVPLVGRLVERAAAPAVRLTFAAVLALLDREARRA